METRGRRVHAIEKSIQLLDCFWLARRPLSLSELEKRTGWAKSTIHGLLASMLDSGVVEQNPGDGKYHLGYHLFELGSAVNQSWDVPNLCRPHLQHLVDCFNESVYLARLSGDDLLLAICEEPHTSFRITSEAGTRLPLHCSSQGKAILANRSRYEAERLLRRAPLEVMTPHTVTDPDRLLDSLAAIRAQGYAEEHEEYKLGLQSVAAPIFSRDGACNYAIGVICMTTVPREAFDAVRVAVVQTANAISSDLR
nr:MAG: transcriptional regulator [Bacteriophage sp.]